MPSLHPISYIFLSFASFFSLNPKWGPKEDNTFLLDCTLAEFADNDGIWFVVRDYDLVSGDDSLGQVRIKADDLAVDASGTPKTFERKINPPKSAKPGTDCGFLTIRCRFASPEDVKSIKKGEKKSYF